MALLAVLVVVAQMALVLMELMVLETPRLLPQVKAITGEPQIHHKQVVVEVEHLQLVLMEPEVEPVALAVLEQHPLLLVRLFPVVVEAVAALPVLVVLAVLGVAAMAVD
jgi:hypothetical protein